MDDLISRQAAIAVAKQHWYKPDIAKALEDLPSAQPEIVRCKDCKYYTSVTAQCEIRGKGLYLIRGLNDFCSKAERRPE